MKLKFLIYFFLFLFSAIKTFSDETNQSLNLNDPYFKLGWKNLNESSNQRIEIPNANASIEVVSSEIYLDEKRDIKNYQEYLYNEETSIENIEDIMIISDKEEYYTIKVRYYDEGYITTDRFKNFTSLNLLETLNKRKDDSVSKFNWILEPSLSENKVSNYGLRVDWVDELITYTYYSVILGKEGFIELRLTLIADGTETEDYFDYYNNLMNEISSTVKFNDQYKYNDFTQGDYISSYTLTNIIDGSWGQGITTDLTNITGYCLVTMGALKKAKIAESDYHRFAGKVITFYIKDSTKEIVDFSEDDSLSVLSGMYGPSDKQKYVKTNKSPNDQNTFDINYSNIIELVGDRDTDKVKYEYKNKLVIKNGKPKLFFAKIDQTGLSFNKWSITLGCQDKEYTESEIKLAKKTLSLLGKNKPEWFDDLVNKVIEDNRNSYSIFIEEDFDTVLFLNKSGSGIATGYKALDAKIITYGGYEFFRGVYDRKDSSGETFVQPASMSNDGEIDSYMKDGFQIDDFVWKFYKRENDEIMISSSSEYLKQIKSYEASDTMFTISTLAGEYWYAGTFKLVKNLDDLFEIFSNNKKAYCNILNEDIVRNGYNTEIQYYYKDYRDFNSRKFIIC